MNTIKGQKIDITKNESGFQVNRISAHVGWSTASSVVVDTSAFMLGENGKVVSEADFVFYGQPQSSCGSVQLRNMSSNGDQKHFEIELHRVPKKVHKVVFTLTIDQESSPGKVFQNVSNIYLRIMYNSEIQLMKFSLSQSFEKETAIVLGELYRYKDDWKFNCVASGYFGGLAALCTDYGLEVKEEKKIQEHKPKQDVPKETIPVKTSKIELKKKEAVNIKKSSKVTAKLEWKTNKDLDLYCFFITKNNIAGKIYYRNLGNPSQSPYITLDGDSKTHGCETIVIHKPDELNFVLFAAYSAVENGTGSFYSMQAKAVVDNHSGDIVTAPLLERNDLSYWVAIARIDFRNSSQMKVEHVETYSKNDSENSPVLNIDGSFVMDAGPVEFKTKWINSVMKFFN